MNRHVGKIMECVMSVLGDEDVAVGLFGSMAIGRANRGSDVDVAIIPRGSWNRRKLTLLREQLEDLNVPYRVELVDFSEVSDGFRAYALESVVWWKNE